MNGSVVVTHPETGMVLTMVNQQLALKDGFQPCSTVKVPVALAALSESIVERTTLIHLYGRTSIGLTDALAKSNNQYFATLGQKLGFERVSYYAKLFGLGEKAGYNIDGEQAGLLPRTTPHNGIGMMTSFGDGITVTPLELAALIGAVANGGNLYYMQYPKTLEEASMMEPRLKRRLDIETIIPEIRPGLAGAVEFGRARRAGAVSEETMYGKTGTCTDSRTPTHARVVRVLYRFAERQDRRSGAADGSESSERSRSVRRGGQRIQKLASRGIFRRSPRSGKERRRWLRAGLKLRCELFPFGDASLQFLAAVIEPFAYAHGFFGAFEIPQRGFVLLNLRFQ